MESADRNLNCTCIFHSSFFPLCSSTTCSVAVIVVLSGFFDHFYCMYTAANDCIALPVTQNDQLYNRCVTAIKSFSVHNRAPCNSKV